MDDYTKIEKIGEGNCNIILLLKSYNKYIGHVYLAKNMIILFAKIMDLNVFKCHIISNENEKLYF